MRPQQSDVCRATRRRVVGLGVALLVWATVTAPEELRLGG